MSIQQDRGTRWFVTINNYTVEDVQKIESDDVLTSCKYLIYCKEKAPSTGTDHIHIYFRLRKRLFKNTIKKWFPRGVIELAKGSELSCYEYISKTGNFKEFGNKYKTAEDYVDKTRRIENILKDVMTLSVSEFEILHPWEAFNHKKKLEEWKFSHMKKCGPWNGELKVKNIWLWGPPGCGKSMWAHQQAPEDSIYLKNVNKWWDGYVDGEIRVVIIEDFPVDDKAWLINILKIWADRYPFNGEVKGGTIRVTPGKWILIVTSNHSIEEVFSSCQNQDVEAIKRRFHEVHMEPGSIIQWTKVPEEELD